MWTNSLLKQNAWNSLKNYYWPALGVTFVAGILGANGGGSYSGGSSSGNLSSIMDSSGSDSESSGAVIAFLLIALVMVLVVTALSMAYVCCVGNVAKVGQCKYFYDARNGDQRFGKLFDNFRNGNYKPTVKTMFFVTLYQFLWSLLFVIPGIIKAYEYFLIPYMLAENPNLDKDRAFEISKKTMEGEKMNLFLLGLSFIGWILLGLCACCIGVYFVQPYVQATYAEFYACMRAKMLSYGYTTEEELTGHLITDEFAGLEAAAAVYGAGAAAAAYNYQAPQGAPVAPAAPAAPAVNLEKPADAPAVDLEKPADAPAVDLEKPADAPAVDLEKPADAPAVDLEKPADAPAVDLEKPADAPAVDLEKPADAPAVDLEKPADSPVDLNKNEQ